MTLISLKVVEMTVPATTTWQANNWERLSICIYIVSQALQLALYWIDIGLLLLVLLCIGMIDFIV